MDLPHLLFALAHVKQRLVVVRRVYFEAGLCLSGHRRPIVKLL